MMSRPGGARYCVLSTSSLLVPAALRCFAARRAVPQQLRSLVAEGTRHQRRHSSVVFDPGSERLRVLLAQRSLRLDSTNAEQRRNMLVHQASRIFGQLLIAEDRAAVVDCRV